MADETEPVTSLSVHVAVVVQLPDSSPHSTLKPLVPADCYAIGYEAVLFVQAPLFDASTIALPAGWSVADEQDPAYAYLVGPTVAGATDFAFTFGQGSTAITPLVQWISPTAPGTTPIQPRPPLRLAPA